MQQQQAQERDRIGASSLLHLSRAMGQGRRVQYPMPMVRRWQLVLAGLVPVMCELNCGNDDKAEAEQVLARHFDALGHHAYETALADYDDQFFEEVTRTEWRDALASVEGKLGTFQRYSVNVRGLESRVTAGPGTYLKFQCQVTYARSTAEETFFLFRRTGSAKFKILAHQIDSMGLLSR
jgi:hypothetical protein